MAAPRPRTDSRAPSDREARSLALAGPPGLLRTTGRGPLPCVRPVTRADEVDAMHDRVGPSSGLPVTSGLATKNRPGT